MSAAINLRLYSYLKWTISIKKTFHVKGENYNFKTRRNDMKKRTHQTIYNFLLSTLEIFSQEKKWTFFQFCICKNYVSSFIETVQFDVLLFVLFALFILHFQLRSQLSEQVLSLPEMTKIKIYIFLYVIHEFMIQDIPMYIFSEYYSHTHIIHLHTHITDWMYWPKLYQCVYICVSVRKILFLRMSKWI